MSDHSNVIDARPTKDLFISMLIKDVPLSDAISDLVDNSVDGALRVITNDDYSGYWVNIEANADHFVISDNCGGIPVALAKEYAFRFGRPSDMPQTPGSVGQFGIGMKRALFKLGKAFRIESVSETSRFVLDVDVDEWEESDDWEFAFTEVEENLPDTATYMSGTVIEVSKLDENVSKRFRLENFISGLAKEIEFDHLYSIANGLSITLNGSKLKARQLFVLDSDDIQTAFFEQTYEEGVDVKIYAGVSSSNLEEGGWYIFCNRRLILGPDQSIVTGWGTDDVTRIPKYHGQYDRFRGYVFFESKDPSLLPWNTTKTGVDIDSPLFQTVRVEMVKMARPVIDFLNKVHQERQRGKEETDEKPLGSALKSAQRVNLVSASTSKMFVAPKPKSKPIPITNEIRMGSIQYSRPVAEINQVKKSLGVRKNEEVGQKTFEYYLEMECGD